MRILVRLVLNWKLSEIISRCCATLSAIGCMYHDMSSWHEFRPWVREVNMYICNINVCITTYAALQTSCNPSGVEPIHWKPTDIDPSSLIYGTNWKVGSFRLNGTNQTKMCTRGRKCTPRSVLGGMYIYTHTYKHAQNICTCNINVNIMMYVQELFQTYIEYVSV